MNHRSSRPSETAPAPDESPLPRASARTSLLRANTAVAIVIATVLALALAALWQSFRATRLQDAARQQQHRAETAESAARAELWRARLAEAKSLRLGQTLDRRAQALDAIRRAAEIFPTPELRHEAVAILALPERQLETALALDPTVTAYELDRPLQHCALGYSHGGVAIHPLSGHGAVQHLAAAEGPVPPEQGAPQAFDFAPDGRRLSVRHAGGALAVWDLPSRSLVFLRDADQRRRPASRGLFSSDGRFLVTPVFTPDGFAVLDAATGQTVAHYPEIGSFHHAAVRPGASQFAAYDGRRVLVRDWTSGATLLEVPLPFGAHRLAWSPDGRWLAIVGDTLEVQLWEITTLQQQRLSGHADTIYDAVFDPAGLRLAGMSFDGTSRIWDLRNGRVLDLSTDRRLLRWGPQERSAWLVPRERIEVWRQQPGAGYHHLTGALPPAVEPHGDVSPDGRWVVTTAAPSGLRIWSLHHPGQPAFLPLPGVQSVTFDPVTPRLLVIRNHALESAAYSIVQRAHGPEFRLAPPVPTPAVPQHRVDLVAVSAHGQTRAFVELAGGHVWIQHLAAPDAPVPVQGLAHSSAAHAAPSPSGAGTIALSPDGRWLVCGADGERGTWVVDAQTGKPLQRLESGVRGVQFSLDGRWLVLSGPPDCRLYRTADWSEVWRKPLEAYVFHPYGAVAIAPDGQRVAFVTAPRRIALVETATGHDLTVLEAPSGSPPLTLRWTAQGGRLIALTREQSLDVWHIETLQTELASLGLDWHAPPPPPLPFPSTLAPPPATARSPGWLALAILLTAGAVAAVALASLRRHRRLIEAFTRTEALVSRRDQELQIEREVSQLKSSFVSMVSHEFRTPLGITMSAVELLRHYADRLPPGKQQELLADIHHSTRDMSDLMEQVLFLGRVEAGKLGFRPARLNLPAVIERLADETSSATRRKCPLHLRFLGDLTEAVGDETLLRPILSNLLSNAVKYSPAGTPVELTVQRAEQFAVFQVHDQGIGIPEQDLPHLFQAFQRASNAADIPGTGLGLVIIKRCLDLHQGTITVRSQPGVATTFTVQLPLFPSPDPATPTHPTP